MTDTPRECIMCGANIEHRMASALTCGDKCRTRYKRWKRARNGYDPRYSRKESRREYVERMAKQAAKTRRQKALEVEEKRKARKATILKRKLEQERRLEVMRIERAEKVKRAETLGLTLPKYGQLVCRYRQYNLTPEEYIELRESQSNRCANQGCGTELIEFSGCVDHCHKEGHVRGILCNACNVSLGKLEESVPRIIGLAEYIKS